MAERVFQIGENYGLDESFRLHYGKNGSKILNPCKEINDDNINIGLVDNNIINPSRLLLLEPDCRPILVTVPRSGEIVKVEKPGKSGIMFLDSNVTRGVFKSLSSRVLGNGIDRRDHLHTASVGDIKKTGWQVYWAPLQMSGHMLHARLVSPSSKDGYPISEKEADSLLKIFEKVC